MDRGQIEALRGAKRMRRLALKDEMTKLDGAIAVLDELLGGADESVTASVAPPVATGKPVAVAPMPIGGGARAAGPGR